MRKGIYSCSSEQFIDKLSATVDSQFCLFLLAKGEATLSRCGTDALQPGRGPPCGHQWPQEFSVTSRFLRQTHAATGGYIGGMVLATMHLLHIRGMWPHLLHGQIIDCKDCQTIIWSLHTGQLSQAEQQHEEWFVTDDSSCGHSPPLVLAAHPMFTQGDVLQTNYDF